MEDTVAVAAEEVVEEEREVAEDREVQVPLWTPVSRIRLARRARRVSW